MNALRQILPDLLVDLAALAGAAAITAGAAMIFLPAGYIVGGVLALAASWLWARSAKGQG